MELAVITGADDGMGTGITHAAVKAGYRIVMAYYRPEKAEKVKDTLVYDTGNPHVKVLGVDLFSLASVATFAKILLRHDDVVGLLTNNTGTMETERRITKDDLERTVNINYVASCLLARKLPPLMGEGSRIVNMVSCTCAIRHLDFPDLFLRGRKGSFWRIPIYSDTKLALTLFTVNPAAHIRGRDIVVNTVDPEVVSTNIVAMHVWFDPLTDIFFHPFIRTPKQGAAAAIHLLLNEDTGKRTGTLNVNCHPKRFSGKYTGHVQMQELWNRMEKIVEKWL